jgi:hypothetical protein
MDLQPTPAETCVTLRKPLAASTSPKTSSA